MLPCKARCIHDATLPSAVPPPFLQARPPPLLPTVDIATPPPPAAASSAATTPATAAAGRKKKRTASEKRSREEEELTAAVAATAVQVRVAAPRLGDHYSSMEGHEDGYAVQVVSRPQADGTLMLLWARRS